MGRDATPQCDRDETVAHVDAYMLEAAKGLREARGDRDEKGDREADQKSLWGFLEESADPGGRLACLRAHLASGASVTAWRQAQRATGSV